MTWKYKYKRLNVKKLVFISIYGCITVKSRKKEVTGHFDEVITITVITQRSRCQLSIDKATHIFIKGLISLESPPSGIGHEDLSFVI